MELTKVHNSRIFSKQAEVDILSQEADQLKVEVDEQLQAEIKQAPRVQDYWIAQARQQTRWRALPAREHSS